MVVLHHNDVLLADKLSDVRSREHSLVQLSNQRLALFGVFLKGSR